MTIDFLALGSGGQFNGGSIENESLSLFTDGQFGSTIVVIVVGDLVDVWLDSFTLTRVYEAEATVIEFVEEQVTVLRQHEIEVSVRQSVEQPATIVQAHDASVSIKRLEEREFER